MKISCLPLVIFMALCLTKALANSRSVPPDPAESRPAPGTACPPPVAYTWDGATGNWSDAMHWTPMGVPGPGDEAIINTGTITLDINTSLGGLTLNNGSIVAVLAQNLNITGAFNWSGGIISGPINLTILPGATLQVKGGFHECSGGAMVTNNGLVNWTDGAISTGCFSCTTASWTNNGVFNAQPATSGSFFGQHFDNFGALNVAANMDFSCGLFPCSFINNPGATVNIAGGALDLSYGGSFDGTFMVGAGAKLNFNRVTTLNPGASITGDGTVRFNDYTTVNTSMLSVGEIQTNTPGIILLPLDLIVPKLTILSGILAGAGTITVTAVMTWTEGTNTGHIVIGPGATLNWWKGAQTGILTIDTGAIMNILGSKHLCLDGASIVNNGTINWTGGEITTDCFTCGFATWTNKGVFNASAPGGHSCFGQNFDNFGTVNLNTDFTLTPGSTPGFFTNRPGGALKVNGGTSTFNNLLFTNDGTTTIGAGTFTATGTSNNQGILNGNGALNLNPAAFTNTGIIAPGLTSPGAGVLNMGDNLDLGAGLLQIEVLDSSASGYDRLVLDGTVTVNGALIVVETGSVPPGTFTILTCNGGPNCRTGAFSTVSLPNCYTLNYTGNAVILTKSVSLNVAISGNPDFCPGDSTLFTASGGSAYAWSTGATTASATVYASGAYTVTVTGGGCVATASVTAHSTFLVQAAIKIFLQGPYVSGVQLMHDSLRVKGLIPLQEPYTGLTNFTHTGGGGSEQTTPGVLAVSGPNAIVDWVFLELRSAVNPALALATRSALLQRDGDVVDVDGVSPVVFDIMGNQSYYLAARHRNHLGVQLGAAVLCPQCQVVHTNFSTLPPEGFYSFNGLNPAEKTVSGVYILWAGNGRIDFQLKYNGSNNDRTSILTVVGLNTPNATVPGYLPADYNMDGVVKYNGSGNDRNVLLGNVGIATPSAIINDQVAR